MLMAAYVRRKRWEAEQQAAAIWNMFGTAMAKGGTGSVGKRAGPREMTATSLLHTIGVEA